MTQTRAPGPPRYVLAHTSPLNRSEAVSNQQCGMPAGSLRRRFSSRSSHPVRFLYWLPVLEAAVPTSKGSSVLQRASTTSFATWGTQRRGHTWSSMALQPSFRNFRDLRQSGIDQRRCGRRVWVAVFELKKFFCMVAYECHFAGVAGLRRRHGTEPNTSPRNCTVRWSPPDSQSNAGLLTTNSGTGLVTMRSITR